ncbi:hypothetical protein NDU88_001853 [Pleurodeles waltl]|uniref:Uncharacterized protein n=1 Tax=Pleurodeles waltl TaxID=8319 RepID=A0AAV7VD38_PLEWA|nr:hypothetical protein NDU88_001853 [Pleurodeles waltl]
MSPPERGAESPKVADPANLVLAGCHVRPSGHPPLFASWGWKDDKGQNHETAAVMAKITEVAQGAPAASAGNAAWRVITVSVGRRAPVRNRPHNPLRERGKHKCQTGAGGEENLRPLETRGRHLASRSVILFTYMDQYV